MPRRGPQTLILGDALDRIETPQGVPRRRLDAALVRNGAELSVRHRLSYWNVAILAAAHRLNASKLYTEDLNHGQTCGSVQAANPFLRARPDERAACPS